MKHQVYISLLLFVCVSMQADFNTHSMADKSERIGRFSYEDSFDEKLVETILKKSSPAVRKNVQRLLYPDENEDMQRLLLLGGSSNAATVAIAKAIAMRCGYEYYVIEASALVRAYREGRQTLLSEVRPIIKQGKPIAIIITELAEMADYSGVLASTLWLLIDQCAQYQDVCVIATSRFKRGELSEEIKDRFGRDIISIDLDKKMQGNIEKEILHKKTSWFERNKTACYVMGGLACFALGVAHLYTQWLQSEQSNKMLAMYEAILSLGYKQYAMQREQYSRQLSQHITELIALRSVFKFDYISEDQYNAFFSKQSEERKKEIRECEEYNKSVEETARKKRRELNI